MRKSEIMMPLTFADTGTEDHDLRSDIPNRFCGKVAEHKSERTQAVRGDEAVILSALSESEQGQLKALLEKLQKKWLSDHAEHHRHK